MKSNKIITLLVLFIVLGCSKTNKEPEKNSSVNVSDSIKLIEVDIDEKIQYVDNSLSIEPNDTIAIDGYELIFQPTDSIDTYPAYDEAKLQEKATDTIGNSMNKYRYKEKKLHAQFSNYFNFNDSVLTLDIENQKSMKLKRWDEENDEGYTFEYFFADLNYFLLYVSWGEGDEHMLVNRKNGFKKRIIGKPFISPNKQRILSINSTMPGYGYNGIDLLTFSGDTIKQEFLIPVNSWGATGAKWIDNDKVVLETEVNDAIESKKAYYLMTIKKKESL